MSFSDRIRYFPVSFFSIILGTTGLAIALQKAETILKIPFQVSSRVLYLDVALFIGFLLAYLLKLVLYRGEVVKEFRHPVKISFFPTISISVLLLSVAFISTQKDVARYLSILGTAIHFLFTLKIVSVWIQHSRFKINHMNPAWFIPAVGNILVPVSGTTFLPDEVSWFFFSVGFFFWIILMVIFFNRIIFHDPLPDKLLPTMFILIAPPAVGFISLVKLTSEVEYPALVLYHFALFLLMIILVQARLFLRIRFFLSWWAYTFPLAAITIATILMYHETGTSGFRYLALGLLGLLGIVFVFLLGRTGLAVGRGEICVEDE